MSPKPEDDMIGKILGDYRIQRLLGKGGMSYVYQALDQQLGRDVAIKLITLHRDRAKELMKRFRREARTLSKLDTHPNIVTIYRYGTEDDDTHYLAMELIRGETLTQRLARHRRKKTYMAFDEIINIMRQIGAALDYAHSNKVIHRDIKPSNIMIEKSSERAVLMDFGLVMDAGTESTLGTAFGTPRYISPEQAISSQQAVFQSDIYSLGIIIYEMLTGHTPFDEDSAMSLALSHITNPPPPLQHFRAEVSDSVGEVVLKALEKQPDDRYQTASLFIDALTTAYERDPFGDASTSLTVASSDNSDTNQEKRVALAAALDNAKNRTPSATDVKSKAESPFASTAPPAVHKSEIATEDTPQKGRKSPIGWIVGIVALLLIVIAVVLALNSSKGDDDKAQSNGDDTTSSEDVLLSYSREYLTIYNSSNQTLNLSGIQLMLPNHDANRTFDTYYIGVNTISNFGPKSCIHITFDQTANPNNAVNPPAPDYCEPDNIAYREYQTRGQKSYYWVWDIATSAVANFEVVLNNTEILKTCQANARQCEFSIPSQ